MLALSKVILDDIFANKVVPHTLQIFPKEGSKETYSLTENFSTGFEDVRITFCAFGLADITRIKKIIKKKFIQNGLFQKKIVPPLLRISIFLKLTPWISSQIYRDPPGIFYFFALTPLENPYFFPQSLVYPLEFQRLLLYPPGIFH